MPNALMYQEDAYVVLEPGEEEVFLTAEELLAKLQGILQAWQGDLPRDLQRFSTLEEQALHLRETACEIEIRPGEVMQWYVVRLEK